MAEPVSLQVVVATASLLNAFSSLGFELDPRHGYALRLWNEIRSRSRLRVTTTARDFPRMDIALPLPPSPAFNIDFIAFNVRSKRLRFLLRFSLFFKGGRERFDKFVKRIISLVVLLRGFAREKGAERRRIFWKYLKEQINFL